LLAGQLAVGEMVAPVFNTTLDRFCGEPTGEWGPFEEGHFTTCFLQLFVFCPVYLVFVIGASLRMRQLFSQSNTPPPRPLASTQVLKIGLAVLLALYNLILFAVHLGFDYGADFQWLTYPVACLTWSYSVMLMIVEFRNSVQHDWVLKTLWSMCAVIASIQLWTEIEEESKEHHHDFPAFVVHYVLYILMAAAGLYFKEVTEYQSLGPHPDMADKMYEDSGPDHNEEFRATRSSSAAAGAKGFPWFTNESSGLKRLVSLFAPDKWLMVLGMVCALIAAPVEVVQFIYMGKIVDDVALQGGVASLKEYIALLLLLYIVEGIATGFQMIVFVTVGERMVGRLRKELYTSVLRQEQGFFDETPADEILRRLSRDTTTVMELLTGHFATWIQSMMQIVVGVTFLFVLTWKLTLVTCAMVPGIALMMLVQATVLQSQSKRTMDTQAKVDEMALEVLSNIRTVQSFVKEDRERSSYYYACSDAYDMAKRMEIVTGVSDCVGVYLCKMCIVFSLFFGGSLVYHDQVSGGILISFIFIVLQVVMAFSVLPPLVGEVSSAIYTAIQLFELIDRTPLINDSGGLMVPAIAIQSIAFHDVYFRYPARPDVVVLEDVQLRIDSGSTLCLVGARRSGKSTVLALIQRFYDAQDGSVLLDQSDIQTFDPKWLHQQIGLISSEPLLFSTTIADNISYGQDALAPQIEKMASLAGVHDYITKLPDGYHTLVGAAASFELPLVVRQQMMIARIFLKSPAILLVDEATAGLDADDEIKVLSALERLISEPSKSGHAKTSVIVPHDPTRPMKHITHVAVLRKGAIVEYGEYEKLNSNERSEYRQFLDRVAGMGGTVLNDEDNSDDEAELQMRMAAGRVQGEMQSRALELMQEFEQYLKDKAGDGGEMTELVSSLKELRESLHSSTARPSLGRSGL
jgi:ABC-type multidrug transport system fused ATPase/permease subunit